MSEVCDWKMDENGQSQLVGAQDSPSCPCCKYKLDGATHSGSARAKPSAGDLSVCLYCSSMLQFKTATEYELLPTKVWEKLHPENQTQLRVVCRKIADLIKPGARLCWHATGWYVVTVIEPGLVQRSKRFETREEIEKIKSLGKLSILIVSYVRKHALGPFEWVAALESRDLGWSLDVESSGPLFADQQSALVAATTACRALGKRFGLHGEPLIVNLKQTPEVLS